jgi:hypothetical protein
LEDDYKKFAKINISNTFAKPFKFGKHFLGSVTSIMIWMAGKEDWQR